MPYRDIDEVCETLKNAKARRIGCSLLLGAGCSVSAGIPTAQGFVAEIKERYSFAYRRAGPKTYPACMAELAPAERHDLIAEYVDKAKINWAHIAIALLMKEGYVDRILTTNFDSLVLKACALLGEFPAIYDFAASQSFDPTRVLNKAVFHLHGQRTGFVILNTSKQVEEQSVAPVCGL
jgi:NAD-dependent SIR2 family protein deacetylase